MTEDEIDAARDAIGKAASLLLEHAEGIGLLAMMARFWEEENKREFPDPAGTGIINLGAVLAYWPMVSAAAQFAGRFEAFKQAQQAVQHARGASPEFALTLREEVEKLVGLDGGPPPALSRVPASAGHAELGITPREVHAQAWRSHLAASAASVGVRA